MNNYWEKRISKEEEKAQRIARYYTRKNKEFYKKALKAINNEINALYAEMMDKGVDSITRSELWQYSHYVALRNEITKQCGIIGEQQLKFIEDALTEVFEDVIGMKLEETAPSSVALSTGAQKDQLMRSVWSGEHYSNRIYKNANALATNLEKSISDLVVLGKTPDVVKKQIMEDMNVSYRVADRLVRTETSHIFNGATMERYKRMGVKEVEILTEPDCCDQCAKYADKKFSILTAPIIPAHPNCRCCYIPVLQEG